MNEHTEQFPFQSLQGEEVSRKLFKDVTTALPREIGPLQCVCLSCILLLINMRVP